MLEVSNCTLICFGQNLRVFMTLQGYLILFQNQRFWPDMLTSILTGHRIPAACLLLCHSKHISIFPR